MAARVFRCFLVSSWKQQKPSEQIPVLAATSKKLIGQVKRKWPRECFDVFWCFRGNRRHQANKYQFWQPAKKRIGQVERKWPHECFDVFCCFRENSRKHRNIRVATFVQPVRSVSCRMPLAMAPRRPRTSRTVNNSQ